MGNFRRAAISESTGGWDVISMTSVDVMNRIINKDNTELYPSTFYSKTNVMGVSFEITGTWGEWLMSNKSDGSLILMTCKIKSGSVIYNNNSYDMNAGIPNGESIVEIVVNLSSVESPAENWINNDNDTASIVMGKSRAFEFIIDNEPSYNISVISVTMLNPILSDTVTQVYISNAFEIWFNDNKSLFNQIFLVVLIGLDAKDENYQWLQPTAYSYSASSTTDESLAAFGALTLVDGNTNTDDLSPTLDIQALIWADSKGANSAIIVSNKKFTEHILMDAAISVIKGSTRDDFVIDDSGTVISNKNDIEWQDFEADDGKIYTPVIPKKSFSLAIQADYVSVSIQGAYFYPNDQHQAIMNLDQNIRFSVGKNKNGEPVFVADDSGLGDATINCIVIPLDGIVERSRISIVVGIISGILCAFTGFVSLCADLAVDSMVLTVDSAFVYFMGADSVFITETTTDVLTAAKNIASGTISACPSVFNTVRIGSTLLFSLSSTIVLADDLVNAIYKSMYQNIPSFEYFADNIAAAIIWPDETTMELVSAKLSDGFVIATNCNIS